MLVGELRSTVADDEIAIGSVADPCCAETSASDFPNSKPYGDTSTRHIADVREKV